MVTDQKINALAAELGAHIDIRYDLSSRGAYADPETGYVAIPESQPDWEKPLAKMHELGHIALHKGLDPWDFDSRLEREAEAWNWALDRADRVPTEQERRRIKDSIESYMTAGFSGIGPNVETLLMRVGA